MLPPIVLAAAGRLATTLMTIVDAIADIATAARSTPTVSSHVATSLFVRLAGLVTTLISISTFGLLAPTKPKPATPARRHHAPRPRPAPAVSLPRHPGWLLAALPDSAPAIAADLDALLADPALATLLAAAPALHHALRPILRALGVTPPSLSPADPPPRAPPPNQPPPPPTAPPSHPAPVQAAEPNKSTLPASRLRSSKMFR